MRAWILPPWSQTMFRSISQAFYTYIAWGILTWVDDFDNSASTLLQDLRQYGSWTDAGRVTCVSLYSSWWRNHWCASSAPAPLNPHQERVVAAVNPILSYLPMGRLLAESERSVSFALSVSSTLVCSATCLSFFLPLKAQQLNTCCPVSFGLCLKFDTDFGYFRW